MKLKEIKELEVEKLNALLTDKDIDIMDRLRLTEWDLLDLMKDKAKQSGLKDDEEFCSISELLEFLEEIRDTAEAEFDNYTVDELLE